MKNENHYDIVFLGGGLAASSLTIHLLRENPDLKIAIIERSEVFPKKVGETTSDLGALFFRRLGIKKFLSTQVQKTGLRFWFENNHNPSFSSSTEYSSPSFLSEANGFQFNRQEVDEYLLGLAEKLGAEVFRPWHATKFHYRPMNSSVTLQKDDKILDFQTTWLIDASGRNGMVSRKMGWRKVSTEHQTAACWGHFKDLPDVEDLDNMQPSDWPMNAIGPRRTATSHFMGYGYWVWWIPLNDGTTSIGAVYNIELLGAEGESPKNVFLNIIEKNSALKEILTDVEIPQLKQLPKLSYTSTQLYKPGLALIGDAAAFVDPLFSPGMELIGQQVLWLKGLILKDFAKETHNKRAWKKYERLFLKTIKTRFLLYTQRYQLMGNRDLFALQTQLDFTGYYNAHVIPSIMFPSLLKYPACFNFILEPIYRFFRWRCLTLAKSPFHLDGGSKIPKIRYSHTSVPFGLRRLTKGTELTLIWLGRYLPLELSYQINRLSSLRNLKFRKKSLGELPRP